MRKQVLYLVQRISINVTIQEQNVDHKAGKAGSCTFGVLVSLLA